MMSSRTASQRITEEVTSWPGIEVESGDRAAHFSFPKPLWADLRKEGRIVPHPVFPDSSGPAARGIESEDDIQDVIALLRLNYERMVARHGHR